LAILTPVWPCWHNNHALIVSNFPYYTWKF